MNHRISRRAALLVAFAAGVASAGARADFVGSFGLNTNVPSIASPDGGLADATSFSVQSFSSNGVTTDQFSGLPAGVLFSGGTFAPNAMTNFTFSNATYGTFTETAAPQMISEGVLNGVVQSITFNILGTFTGGAAGSAILPSSLVINFTQNGGPGHSLSASGTLTIPPVVVPAPASVALMGLGLAGGVGALGRRLRATPVPA